MPVRQRIRNSLAIFTRFLPLLLVGAMLVSLGLNAPFQGLIDAGKNLGADRYVQGVIVFTLKQAFLSTVLSVVLALPVARALSRRKFRGRDLILRLFGLPLVLPGIVVVLGLIAVYGQQGWLAGVYRMLGLSYDGDIYGLPGILLAHAFFDMPLAVRLLLPLLIAVPPETWRLSAQLNLRGVSLWRLVEWPALKRGLMPTASLIFLLCFISFVPVLVLGGGPAATTLEVAIFQALRYEGDIARVVILALVQAALAFTILVAAHRFTGTLPVGQALRQQVQRFDGATRWAGIGDVIAIGSATIFVLLPVLAVGLNGILSLMDLPAMPGFGQTLQNSIILSGICAVLTPLLALGVLGSGSRRHAASEISGAAGLILPPAAFSAGLFVSIARIVDPFAAAIPAVAMAGLFGALPYAIRFIGPALQRSHENYDRLCASLRLTGWGRFRLVTWPCIRSTMAGAAAFAALIGAGDLGAIALFGSQHTGTLPYYIYQSIGSYRWPQGEIAALVLILGSITTLWLIERGIRGK